MTSLRTIEDLHWAQANDPEAIEEALKKVAIKENLSEWLEWIYHEEVSLKFVVNLNRKKWRSSGLHPSTICKKGVCLLKVYYEAAGSLKPLRQYKEQNNLTFDVGTMVHVMLQSHLDNMFNHEKQQFESEVRLRDDELHIRSSTDGLFTFPDLRFILEIKSIKAGGNFGFEKVQHEPLEDTTRQTNMYMRLADVPFGLVFYFGKNTSDTIEHALTFDQELWDEIHSDVIDPVVKAAWGKGKMVKASPGWHCRQCDYQYGCPHSKKGADPSDAHGQRTW